jgi:hypothetical protein
VSYYRYYMNCENCCHYCHYLKKSYGSSKKNYGYCWDGCMKNQNFRYYERCNHFPSYLMKNYDSPKKSPYYVVPPDYYWCDYCSKNA